MKPYFLFGRLMGSLFLCLVFTTALFAQQGLPDHDFSNLENIAVAQPFELVEAENRHHDYVSEVQYLQLQQAVVDEIIAEKEEQLGLSIPTGDGSVVLHLQRVELFTNDYQLRTSRGAVLRETKEQVFYQGIIANKPTSRCAVSFFPNEVRVLFADENGNRRITRLDAGTRYAFYYEKDWQINPNINCAVQTEPDSPPDVPVTNTERLNGFGDCLDMYFECDFQTYQDNGSSVAQTEQFVTATFNEAQILFSGAGIPLHLSEIFVWNSPDPYPDTPDNIDGFIEFLTNFADFRQDNYNGRMAQLLTTRTIHPLYYGLAIFASSNNPNVICNTYESNGNLGPYSMGTRLEPNPAAFPNYSINLHVMAHELAHNLGAQHTHACVWNGDNTQIDDCASVYFGQNPNPDYTAPDCYDEFNPILPDNGGTIMSYCQRVTGVGVNFSLGFHPQVRNVIQNEYNNAPCLTGEDCTPPISCEEENVFCLEWLRALLVDFQETCDEDMNGVTSEIDVYTATYDGELHVYVHQLSQVFDMDFAAIDAVYDCAGQQVDNCFTDLVNGGVTCNFGAMGEIINNLQNENLIWSCDDPIPPCISCDLSFTTQIASPSCGENNGSIIIMASGGTPAYQYSIGGAFSFNNSYFNLSAGTYLVTVRDSENCEETTVVTLQNQGSDLSLTISSFPTLCSENTGSINLTVNGGTPTYTYTWQPSQGNIQDPFGLPVGFYSVTVTDANGCTASISTQVGVESCPPDDNPVCGSDGNNYANPCEAMCAGVGYTFGECAEEPCICPALYLPVCGSDGITYSNACYAECAGIEEYEPGECYADCFCPAIYDPVCGSDGNTYSNACIAECAGVDWEPGECEPLCVCPHVYDPVCGSDGLTYSNACLAECAGVSWEPGPCDTPCLCEGLYDPVCGSDGNTYSNSCYAECAGVSWEPGICNEPCICDNLYDPVCGVDGITYSNACYADCAGVEWTAGVCSDDCNCPGLYDPVCGSDGNTYYNSCFAECANVDWNPGECEEPCTCPPVYDPVCGTDGITYQNICYAECAGVGWTPGICEETCDCNDNYDPVCGTDGNTYTNACYANCAGVGFTAGACFPPADNILCLDWVQDIVNDFGTCGTDETGVECGQNISLANYQGAVLVIVYEYCNFPFNSSWTRVAYTLEGEALDRCEAAVLSINCDFFPPNGAIFDALINEEIIWSCGDDLPDCYCSLDMVVSTTLPDCGGDNGIIQVTQFGGTPPYTYSIGTVINDTGLFTNLTEGVYTVQVTDANGCTMSAYALLFTEGYPNCLNGEIDIISDPDDCESLGINVSGVFPNTCMNLSTVTLTSVGNLITIEVLTFIDFPPCETPGSAWEETLFTAVTPGNYTVQLLINGEFVTDTDLIVPECQTCDIVLALNGIDPDCGLNNGTITATASNGTPPYSYNFGSGFQSSATQPNLPAGAYNVTVMDSEDCTAESSITLMCNAVPISPTFYVDPALTVVDEGDFFTVDVRVRDFEDIRSMQFAMSWNSDLVTFESLQNFNSILGLGLSSFNTPASGGPAGRLAFIWFNNDGGIDLSDDTILFSVRFEAITAGMTTFEFREDLSPVAEITNGAEQFLDFNAENGDITINADNPGTFILAFAEENACAGDIVCVDVIAENATNITLFNFPVVFDPAELNFLEFTNFNPNIGNGSGNYYTVAPGAEAVIWGSLASPPFTLDPGATLLTICFEKLTDNSTSLAIEPYPGQDIEIYDANTNPLVFASITGEITSNNCPGVGTDDQDGDGYSAAVDCNDDNPEINPGAEEIPGNNVDEDCDDILGELPADMLTFIGGDVTGSEGDTVMMPVTVRNFTNISGFQFTMTIPEANQGSFVEFVSSTALTGISVNPANGIFRVIWNVALGVPPVDLPDDTIIFWVKVRLQGMPGNCSIVTFENSPTAISAVEGVDNSFVPATISGTFCVSSTVNITGTLLTELQLPVSGAQVEASDGQVALTAADGTYELLELPASMDYTLEPHRNIEHSRGVSVGDIVLIRAHIIGFQDLDSPYKIIAADATGDDFVSVLDLITLQRLVIGFLDTLPGNESWRFVPAEYDFVDPSAPLNEDFPEHLIFTNIDANIANADFVGIKVGDVNGDVVLLQQAPPATAFQIQDQEYKQGAILDIPIWLDTETKPAGWQSSFELPLDEFELLEVIGSDGRPLARDQYHQEKDLLRVIWYEQLSTKLTLEPDGNLLHLRVRALQAGQLSEVLKLAPATSLISDLKGRETLVTQLIYHDTGKPSTKIPSVVTISTCYPQPFQQKCTFTLTSSQRTWASLRILDLNGAMVWRSSKELLPGTQNWEIPAEVLPSTGLCFYHVQTPASTHTGKLIHNR